MTEHRKISRVLQLIARLRHPFGYEKQELARTYDVNIRTIERYIVLIKDLGFNVVQEDRRFKIDFINKTGFKQEDHIVFTLEEAKLIKDALLCSNASGPLRSILLDKLYSLTDIDDLATTMSKLNHSNTISLINEGIRHKLQVVLKAYSSSRTKACDRLVEPIRFYAYYQYVKAYEVKAGKVKVFKTDRIGGVELTNTAWAFEKKHNALEIDPFGISGSKPIMVQLLLEKRAWQLLCEEHPEAVPSVYCVKNKWEFKGPVYGFEGVGRFVMGLIDQVQVIAPAALKEYVLDKVEGGVGRR